MNLHKILSTVPPQWRPIAAHYVRTWQIAGVPESSIDRLVQWGLSYEGSSDETEMLTAFRDQASRLGLSDDVTTMAADLGLEARNQINSGKFTPEPVQADESGKLLQDIRAYRQQWPDAWEQDQEMQAIERQLIAASLGEKSAAGAVSVQPSKTLDADLRLREIRQIIRDDPDALTRNPTLEREQMALIEAQIASRPAEQAAPVAPAAPAQAAAE